MYVIVEFTEEEVVALIHKSWMVGNTECLWPQYKSQQRIDRAAQSGQEPDSSFRLHKCRILYSSNTYDKARQKLKEAEETSDLGTEAEGETPQKRQKRPNARYRSDSEDEVQASHRPVSKKSSSARSPPNSSPPCGSSSSMSRPPLPTPPPPPHGLGNTVGNSPHTPPSFSATDRKILTLLEELKAQGRQTQAKVNQLLSTQDGPGLGANGGAEMPDGVELPLATLQQMEEVEGCFCRQEVQKGLLAFLCTIGGESTTDTVRRVMRTVMTNDVAKQLNWLGKGRKTAFAGLKIQLLIAKAVRKNRTSRNATDSDIEKVIKEWLRYAKDRDGGRKSRTLAAKTAAATAAPAASPRQDDSSDEQ